MYIDMAPFKCRSMVWQLTKGHLLLHTARVTLPRNVSTGFICIFLPLSAEFARVIYISIHVKNQIKINKKKKVSEYEQYMLLSYAG